MRGPAALGALALWVASSAATPRPAADLERLGPGQLEVTQGSLEPLGGARVRVEVAKMRAVARTGHPQVAELAFTYLGPTARLEALASGEPRRQLGLKLAARDGCNVLYVMWRLVPQERLVVQLKHNPGQRASGECGNRGYRTLRPWARAPLPALVPGWAHRLRAELREEALAVFVDGQLVWEGPAGSRSLPFTGPVGLRSDNVRAELELSVAAASQPGPEQPPPYPRRAYGKNEGR